jgi:exodeoxyribonuclease V alpha subunit
MLSLEVGMTDSTSSAATHPPGDLDRHFGRFISRFAIADKEAVLAAATLASRATSNGDVCIDLARHAELAFPEYGFTTPPLAQWSAALRACPAVGKSGDMRPLVLDDEHRLYLYRYWQYEMRLAEALRARAIDEDAVDIEKLRAGLERLFPDPHDAEQKHAAAMAVLRRLCVITGGPGTGKTYTVVKILALLAEQARGRKLAVALAAPTGKAAARVQEAVRGAMQRLEFSDAVRDCIPAEAYTLHRLLGARPDSVYYRHGRDNPLALDVLVVDEASMADLALMAKLMDALPPRARLILLGDKDQLASVEAGAVLGDICAGAGVSTSFAARFERVTAQSTVVTVVAEASPLGDSIAFLERSYRFAADTGIGKLATLVNKGSAEALQLLKSNAHRDIVWHSGSRRDLNAFISGAVAEKLASYLDAVRSRMAPAEIFERFNAFRVLCAHRSGAFGAVTLNRMIETALLEQGMIDARRVWYPGRPIMVMRNDYNLQLFNGDVGIALEDEDGALRVHFPRTEGGMRTLAPVRLPEHESVYAMTIHKAQGSEFGCVVIILPDELSRVMSRELIYTGITRARNRVEVWGDEDVLRQAIARGLVRASALRQRLWSPR